MLRAMTGHESFLPVLLLLLFMAIFIGVLWFVLSDRRKGLNEHMRNLPLDDGETDHAR